MTAYSAPADMIIGNIPTTTPIQMQYLNLAADEMDSVLGMQYVTPINVAEDSPVKRHSRLLLKNISIWLSSGRLMLATSANGEDDQLHAYAKYLVENATAMLMKIASGEIKLDGAEHNEDEENPDASNQALIYNVDPESNVEAFYDRIYMAPPAYPVGDRSPWAGG